MEILNSQSFKKKVFDYEHSPAWKFNGERPAIIDFYADWCAPCRALGPVLDGVSREYAGKVDVYKVNTETDPELASLFGVRGIPAVLFVPKTGEPKMATGFMPIEAFRSAIGDVFGIR